MSDRRTGTWLRGGKGILAGVAAAYLALLPLGSFLVIPVGGTHATGSDLLLAILLLLGGVTWVRSPGFRATVLRGLAGGWRAIRPGRSTGRADDVGASVLLLAGFSVWAMVSAAWGFHPEYAVVKGAGYAALTAGVAVVVWSGIEWDRALAAWLIGTLLTVGLSLALAGVGAASGDAGGWGWARRTLYEGGSLVGLPGLRLRGPFLHPNGLGDYLVVSGALLWAAWPLRSRLGRGRSHRGGGAGSEWVQWASRVFVVLLVASLVLTLSSAWVAAGTLLLLWGRRLSSSRAGQARNGIMPPLLPLLLRGGGALVTATTLAALVFPLRLGWGDVRLVTSGIRVRIWEDALRAFLSSPIAGVGAAPVLADAVDPVDPGPGLQLWDAHSAYLSVMGQFGLVGTLLVAGAAFFVVRGLLRSRGAVSTGTIRRPGSDAGGVGGDPGHEGGAGDEGDDGFPGIPPWRLAVLRERARKGVLAALSAVGVHGLVIAGEDFRHWWALVAVAALVVRDAAGTPRSVEEERS